MDDSPLSRSDEIRDIGSILKDDKTDDLFVVGRILSVV